MYRTSALWYVLLGQVTYYTVLQRKKKLTHRGTLRPQIVEIKAGCRDIGAQSFHFLLFGYYVFMCDVLDEKF